MIKLERIEIKEEPLELSEEWTESSDFLAYSEKFPLEDAYFKDVLTVMKLKQEPTHLLEIPITNSCNHHEHQKSTKKCEVFENYSVYNLETIDGKINTQSRELKRLKSHALGPKMVLCDSEIHFSTEENSRKKRKNITLKNYSKMLHIKLPKEIRKASKKKYNVEKIMAKRITRLGRSEYLVKWEGYTEKSNTWEPPSSFEDLSLIIEFEKSRDGEKCRKSLNIMKENSTIENFTIEQRNCLYEEPKLMNDHLLSEKNVNFYKKCMTCEWSFYNMDKFCSHISLPHTFGCMKCDKKFTTRGGLARHLNWIHNPKDMKKKSLKNCPEVNVLVNESEIVENILYDFEKWYVAKCEYCETEVLFSFLNEHILSVHTGKSLTCFCGFDGKLHSILIHSLNDNHLPNENRSLILRSDGSQSVINFIPKLNIQESRTFPCYKCSKMFKVMKSRNLHYNLCKLERKLTCLVCFEKFALPNHLQKHMEWKHGFGKCDYCNTTFNSKPALLQHVEHVHRKSNELLENYSLYSLSDDNDLNALIKQPNTNEDVKIIELLILTESDLDTSSSDDDSMKLNFSENKKCVICGDAFITFQQLKVHTRMHTRKRPHECQHCSLKFISRNLLLKHKIKSHENFLSKKEIFYKIKERLSVSSDSSDSEDSSIL